MLLVCGVCSAAATGLHGLTFWLALTWHAEIFAMLCTIAPLGTTLPATPCTRVKQDSCYAACQWRHKQVQAYKTCKVGVHKGKFLVAQSRAFNV